MKISTFAHAILLQTCYRLVVYVADLLVTQRGSHQLVTDLLRWNWCNGFWPKLLKFLAQVCTIKV